jgi:hypothetical protein
MSRAMTEDEAGDLFLKQVAAYVAWWDAEARAPTAIEKLEGLAHSILVILDGGAGFLPGFKVIPDPHEDDERYHRDRNEDWWPNDVDIAGDLHERIHEWYPERPARDSVFEAAVQQAVTAKLTALARAMKKSLHPDLLDLVVTCFQIKLSEVE